MLLSRDIAPVRALDILNFYGTGRLFLRTPPHPLYAGTFTSTKQYYIIFACFVEVPPEYFFRTLMEKYLTRIYTCVMFIRERSEYVKKKFTTTIDEDLLVELKVLALREKTEVNTILEDLIKQLLDKQIELSKKT